MNNASSQPHFRDRQELNSMFAAGAPGFRGPKLETKKALLLIDLQNDFVDKAGKLFVPNTAEFLPKLPALIRQFRSDKRDVFFVRTEYAEPRSIYSDATGGYGLVLKSNVASRQPSVFAADGEDGSQHHSSTPPAEASLIGSGGILNKDVEAFLTPPYNSQASWSQCCVAGSSGALMPEILASAMDPTLDTEVIKSHYSPFHDASFLLHLRMQLITELYICGSLSNISVYSTVIDAVSHGMSVTIIEDCVGYRDERYHREAMRLMADSLGANGIDYQELLDDLAGLLGDVVHEEDFKTRYDVAFQRGLQNKDKPDPKQKASAWLSSLDESASETREARSSLDEALLRSNSLTVEASKCARQNTEPLSDLGPRRQQTPESPPRKRQFDDPEPDGRGSKVHTRRRASHEGYIGDTSSLKPNRPRRRRPQTRDRRSPTPRQDVRPPIGSKSTGDIPLAAAAERLTKPSIPQTNGEGDPKSERIAPSASDIPKPREEKPLRRSPRTKKAKSPELLGPGDSIGTDSHIILDLLPNELSSIIFDNLNTEISWQKMYHRAGEVPRMVAVQGECSPTKIPIYRHPADSSPPLLPFTPHIQIVRMAAEKLIGHPLNHVLIQLYRSPEDNISEHSDKTLDIVRGSKIVNYSAGALRTMILRGKKSVMSPLDVDVEQTGGVPTSNMSPGPSRPALRVPLPHNSLFVLGPETNRSHLHSIRADKRPSSIRSTEEQAYNASRISLTFRHIGTFINPERSTIWGQGATSKTAENAKKITTGAGSEAEYGEMIRAFGQENHRSNSWDWDEHYGCGFGVVDGPNVPHEKNLTKAKLSPSEKINMLGKAQGIKETSLAPGIEKPDKHIQRSTSEEKCLI